jgi:hypothetical protein
LSDLRGIPRTTYQCPVVEIDAQTSVEDVRRAAIEARAAGLVIARHHDNTLVIAPRDGAVAALGIAQSLGGTLRSTSLEELKGRTLEAV